jgi:hypothetical protein
VNLFLSEKQGGKSYFGISWFQLYQDSEDFALPAVAATYIHADKAGS